MPSQAALCKGCRRLASLDIGGCSLLTEAALGSISMHCRHMISLDLGGCKAVVTDTALILMAQVKSLTHFRPVQPDLLAPI